MADNYRKSVCIIIANFNTIVITTHILLKIRIERETIDPTLLYITYIYANLLLSPVSARSLI